MDELTTVIQDRKADIIIITETWLNDTIPDSAINIDGYNAERNDRIGKQGGGVCAYIKQSIQYTRWKNLEDADIESIWITLKLKSLPREVSNVTIVGIYHPPHGQQ